MKDIGKLKMELRDLRLDIKNTVLIRNSLQINAPFYFSRILEHLRALEKTLESRIEEITKQ